MEDYFQIRWTDQALNAVSNLALAHIGDGVYELLARTWVVCHGSYTNRQLHQATVAFVSAAAQARAAERVLPALTEAERRVYRRGRNSHVHSVPKKAEVGDYHAATGLECLFGWLYLRGERERISALFGKIMEGMDTDTMKASGEMEALGEREASGEMEGTEQEEVRHAT